MKCLQKWFQENNIYNTNTTKTKDIVSSLMTDSCINYISLFTLNIVLWKKEEIYFVSLIIIHTI